MANVNIFELEECLRSLIPFVEKHRDKSWGQEWGGRVRSTLDELEGALQSTDRRYLDWRNNDGQGRMALKRLHRTWKGTQRKLSLLGAMGYPDYTVDYLNVDDMEEAANAMIAYLRAHRDSLDFADEAIASMTAQMERSDRGFDEGVAARDDYQKSVARRIRAMEQAEDLIRSLRIHARADLGVDHKDYRAVRWPATLAPDRR